MIKYPEILAACTYLQGKKLPTERLGNVNNKLVAQEAVELYDEVLKQYKLKYHPPATFKVEMTDD